MAFDGVCPVIARQKFDSVCQTERVHEILGTSQIAMSRFTINSGHSPDALAFAA